MNLSSSSTPKSPVVKPSVLFVGPMLGAHPGWVPNPAECLAPHLAERGYSCSLVSYKVNRYHRLIDILTFILRNYRKIDLLSLQVYGGPSFVVEDAASLLARILGLPVVMMLHGGDLPYFFRRFPNWARRVLRRANAIVVPSGFLEDTVKAYEFHTTIIPNAIEIKKYPFSQRNFAQPRLLWMRTFHEIYNPVMAVEVFARVKQECPEARLTMAGQEKGLLEAVQQRVRQLKLTESVHFAGFLDIEGKRNEFARNNIFLNTNRIDNMPVSLVEAAAFGMPIIATAVGGVPYMIKDGENGLLVANEDINAMTQAVLHLINESGLGERLSRNARAFAEYHDWSVVLPRWESLFQEVMDSQV